MKELIDEFTELANKVAREGTAKTEQEIVDFIQSIVLIGAVDYYLTSRIMSYEVEKK